MKPVKKETAPAATVTESKVKYILNTYILPQKQIEVKE